MSAILGALIIGLSLGLLGSGGSILTVPILTFLVGEPEKLAIAESLGIVAAIAGVSALGHIRQRHVDWRSVALVGPAAMAGSYVGAWGSQWLSGRTQLLLFAIIMLVAAYRMYMSSRATELQPNYCRPGCLLGVGIGLGIVSGVVGVGGGFLYVPALVLLGGLAMPTAVGTSLVVIALSAAIGFAKQLHVLHASNLSPHWSTFAVFVAVGTVGSLASHPLGRLFPPKHLQRVYSAMVVMVAVATLWQVAIAHS